MHNAPVPTELASEFFRNRGVDASRATPQQIAAAHGAAEIARTTLELSQACQERLVALPTWSLILSALWRVQEYAEGSIATSIVSLPAAEITARTVVEGSINIRYLLAARTESKLHAYFRAYLMQEEVQNVNWSREAALLPPGPELAAHHAGLDQKSRVLRGQAEVVDTFFREIGVDTTAPEHWGSAFERFRAVGAALEYRTTYVALCSQAHNDAEDLINIFTIQATENTGLVQSLQRETQAFSWFAVTLGLQHYVRAAAAYWRFFDLLPDEPIQQLVSSLDLLASDAAHRVRTSTTG